MAKLNAKKRNALKSTTFCGPKRSFPIPDCKHAKAALSLLGRYKGPGNKSSIRACIYRKAKALGCFKSKDFTVGSISLMLELSKMVEENQMFSTEYISQCIVIMKESDILSNADIVSICSKTIDSGEFTKLSDLYIDTIINNIIRSRTAGQSN